MNHPSFRNVELAMNGVNNRNNIVDIRAVRNFQGHTDSYMTYFRYDEHMIDHFEDTKTVTGFTGPAYADFLPIDIDAEDLQQAQDQLQHLLYNMNEHGVDENVCKFYFSGAKGFHVMIPSGVIGAEPSEDIHERFRRVAEALSDGITIDTGIYNKTRLFRLPNTINSKTGLYKIQLYPFQATSLSITQIKDKAREPSERLDVDDEYDVSDELHDIYQRDPEKPTATNTGPVKTYLCMAELMKGVGDGQRDNTAVRVASHLRRSGLSAEMIWAALDEWNEKNDPPMETSRLEAKFHQGLKGYEFGCHDFLMKENCSPDCLFYRPEWGRF